MTQWKTKLSLTSIILLLTVVGFFAVNRQHTTAIPIAASVPSTTTSSSFDYSRDFIDAASRSAARVAETTTTTEEPTTTTTSPPPPAVKQTSTPRTTIEQVTRTTGDVWEALRQCESGGNYADNTGNGYYGAYQFSLGTWSGLGYSGLPSNAAPETQDEAAQKLQARSGWGQWPACSRQLGLR